MANDHIVDVTLCYTPSRSYARDVAGEVEGRLGHVWPGHLSASSFSSEIVTKPPVGKSLPIIRIGLVSVGTNPKQPISYLIDLKLVLKHLHL